jgi:2-polyprenyl-6-methoxyphenol hydroxylase-like FAD-dependent oxidoreductase
MTELSKRHAVVIAGGGPTGMMLAAELTLAGVDVVIVEKRANEEIIGSRAGGLHARTIEIFDQRGIAGRFLKEGQKVQAAGFAGVRLDIGDFPTRHPYTLGLWQKHIERILLGWVKELGVPIQRNLAVTGLSQDGAGVDVEVGDGRTLRADYLVGCDGGRSVVRKAAGIAFPGSDPTVSHLIAEAELAEEPEWGVRYDARGMHGLGKLEYEIRDGEIVYKDHGPVRIMLTEDEVGRTDEPTLDDIRQALISIYGTDYGVHNPTSISRFNDSTRQAETYRKGRVLLAGDAAHIHYPAGGHGLNIGVQDAVNLGWKLAQVVKGTSPESLLDTYHAERHAVGARVLRETMAAVALNRRDDRSTALNGMVAELAKMEEPRRYLGGMASELDVHYALGEGHPLLGRRMPDLDIETAAGKRRVYGFLHDAKPLLISFGAPIDIAPCADRVQAVQAEYHGTWELPVIGSVAAPAAVLVRPDGHVAWVGEGNRDGLDEALNRWFGAAA